MQIKSLLKQGRSFLAGRENALLECELILAAVLGESKEYVFRCFDEEVQEGVQLLYMNYLGRLRSGEPLAYILNEKEFFGMNFYVDDRVLIPRPETEQIVEKILAFVDGNPDKKYRMLDVGTGSGNIALSLASREAVSDVLALDLSFEALEVARINVEQFSLESKVQLAQSDLLESLEEGEYFDAIATNLPYIGSVRNRFVSADTEKFEPRQALFGGDSGLELYEKMFQQIEEKRIDFELMVGEFGFAQGEQMRIMLNKYFEQKWRIESDLAGIERIFVIENHA